MPDWICFTTVRRLLRYGALYLLLPALLCASGCGIQPWVKPYERQYLADQVMNPDRNPVSSSYMHHVYQAREGARGAEGGSGGGCGCN